MVSRTYFTLVESTLLNIIPKYDFHAKLENKEPFNCFRYASGSLLQLGCNNVESEIPYGNHRNAIEEANREIEQCNCRQNLCNSPLRIDGESYYKPNSVISTCIARNHIILLLVIQLVCVYI